MVSSELAGDVTVGDGSVEMLDGNQAVVAMDLWICGDARREVVVRTEWFSG